MRVRCKINNAKNLNLNEVTDILTNQHYYGLTLEKDYIVMGMMVPRDTNCIYYLIDEGRFCHWMPYVLFEITDRCLPKNWYISIYDQKEIGDIAYVCGFYELCNDDNFYDDLMEREPYAMQIYFHRKIEFHEDL